MENKGIALVLIILGIIFMAVPVLGILPFSLITGFIVLLLGVGLIVGGITTMGESAGMGIIGIILGIIAFALGIGFIINPGLFSWLIGFLVWIVGLFLIIAGILGILSGAGGSRWNGVIALIIGVIYIIVGSLVANPQILGALIGLWLLISGIVMLFARD
ncbi:MAG: DUF308 domain-containing protein [Methanobacterium sp.]|nr:DUF308 domain-containing protein [Methanobacterium sp.]